MKLTHNDVTVDVPDGTTIEQMMTIRDVKHPKYAVVEVNGDIIPQDKWAVTVLNEDDEFETAFLAGGGSI